MSNGSMLPPDIQEEVARRATPPSSSPSMGGIGGAAHENATAARSRSFAMGDPVAEAEPEANAAPEVEKEEEITHCRNATCGVEAKSEWDFCAKCGADLLRGGLAEKLGVEFTEDDVHDYLFRGFVMKEVRVLGKHKALLKSSQPKDLAEIDDFIMNGKWGKAEDGRERKVSDFYLRQINALAIAAASIQKIDGNTIGETLPDRVTWLSERGSGFVDMLTARVAWFNQAITEFLKKEDTIPGS